MIRLATCPVRYHNLLSYQSYSDTKRYSYLCMFKPINTAIKVKIELSYEYRGKNTTAKSKRVCSQDFLERKDHDCAKRCFPKEIMKCFLCTTGRAENTFPFMKSLKRSLLSFPCVPTAFLTLLTTLQLSDFKAGCVVALLKESIWKHVQL